MGSRLPIIIGALAVARLAAAQPGPLPAAETAKQGVDLYNANRFAEAAAAFQKALDLEPNNEGYKFMLAQSLRKSGRCDAALPHYQAIAATAPADQKAEIDAGVAECTPKPVAPPPPPPPPEPAPAPAPSAGGGGANISMGTAGMLAGGGLALGAGVVLIWAAHTHSGDADAARSVKDYNRISDRSTTEYVLGAVGIAAGVTLTALAYLKIRAANKNEMAVAFTPNNGGGTLVLERSW